MYLSVVDVKPQEDYKLLLTFEKHRSVKKELNKEIKMLDINKIEKFTTFPKYFEYIKLSILSTVHYHTIFIMFLYLNDVPLILSIVFFVLLLNLFYFIDLKIFKAFKNKGQY